jgi:hypothetical protein
MAHRLVAHSRSVPCPTSRPPIQFAFPSHAPCWYPSLSPPAAPLASPQASKTAPHSCFGSSTASATMAYGSSSFGGSHLWAFQGYAPIPRGDLRSHQSTTRDACRESSRKPFRFSILNSCVTVVAPLRVVVVRVLYCADQVTQAAAPNVCQVKLAVLIEQVKQDWPERAR